ncbi:GNAT family N-acetyltransferase [Hymenobacter caeli]|uniref:RimJ/RimL family protein N-acetyltransferase n=1 Tax=Hymenobacter caeli TaxID=2735894 RepID=A0ABX2FS90_9BACT|nr:GNAT family N-acetyltransferase [Hymenobacter caeli]NRT19994.1 RimJ/RimL family protein N-acetyltransferase [Hymenobacter caeli]
MQPFKFARLRYRPLGPADAAGLFALDSNPNVLRYLGTPPLTGIAQSRAALVRIQADYRAGTLARWAVERRDTGEFLGWAGLKLNHDPVNGRSGFIDLGYRLLEPHWGQGYGTEAGRAWLARGFGALRLPLITGYAEAAHGASRRILEKVGLALVNLFDDASGTPCAWYEARNPAAGPA